MPEFDLLTNFQLVLKCYDGMLKEICETYRLSLLETKIISFLFHHPRQNTVKEISELRMLSKGNVSTAVEKLIRKSVLEKREDPSDKRRFLLFLTPAVNPITEEIEKIRSRFFRMIYSGFSEEERKRYAFFRDRMTRNILENSNGE